MVLLYIPHALDKLSSGILEGFDVNLRKKAMLVTKRNMKTVSDQAKSPFCL